MARQRVCNPGSNKQTRILIMNLFQHIMRVWCERFEPFYVDVKGVQEVMASRKPEALWFMAHQAFMKVCSRRSKMFQIFHCIIFSRKNPIFLLQQKLKFEQTCLVQKCQEWFMAHQVFMKVCSKDSKMFYCIIYSWEKKSTLAKVEI